VVYNLLESLQDYILHLLILFRDDFKLEINVYVRPKYGADCSVLDRLDADKYPGNDAREPSDGAKAAPAEHAAESLLMRMSGTDQCTERGKRMWTMIL
jgi:hypothetical protein